MNDIKGIIEDVEKSSLVSSKVIKKVIKIIGQEEWNNIHDEESDICTTTGELIITLKGIAELEKENAELKEQCLLLADCNTCHSTCKNENVEIKKQLTKAKEIIKRLHDIVCGKSGDDWELIEEVEQFISEVENDRNRKKSD